MRFGHLSFVAALAVPLLTPIAAQAFDDAKYPDWKGEWRRVAVPAGKYPGVQFDPHKPAGPWQEAPLTPEYQRIFETNLADQAEGGQAGDPTFKCLSPGMPRVMGPYGAMEIVVMPETTYVLIDHIRDSRRIHTDGRDFPAAEMANDPLFTGYSVGRWVDETKEPIWWKENVCTENNVHVDIRNEVYFLSGDGLLMPSKKGQAPPDLRYFNRPNK
jgi:hypothetical protein